MKRLFDKKESWSKKGEFMAYADFTLIEGRQVPKPFERELKIIMTPKPKRVRRKRNEHLVQKQD